VTAVITVHGIRSDGSHSVDLLGEELANRGHRVVDCNLGHINLFEVVTKLRSRKYQYKLAQRLANVATMHHRPAVVAHSFGCLATLRAMELGATFSSVFFFAPAMDKDFLFPAWGCESWDVVYHPGDRAIKLGGILRMHDFGRMGTHGSDYAHLDHRGRNHKVEDGGTGKMKHSYAFQPGALSQWADVVEQRLAA
jgi:hypothetical protein